MAAHQAPPSLGFSRQEYWSGLPARGLLTPITSTSFCVSYPPLSLCDIAFISTFPSHTSKQVYLLQSEPPIHSTARTIYQNSSLITSLPCLQQFWSLSRAFGSKSKLPAQCTGVAWCSPASSPTLLPFLFSPLWPHALPLLALPNNSPQFYHFWFLPGVPSPSLYWTNFYAPLMIKNESLHLIHSLGGRAWTRPCLSPHSPLWDCPVMCPSDFAMFSHCCFRSKICYQLFVYSLV